MAAGIAAVVGGGGVDPLNTGADSSEEIFTFPPVAGNAAQGDWSAVVGGAGNTADGNASVILGGLSNSVTAFAGLAAGVGALVSHDYSAAFGFDSAGKNASACFSQVGWWRLLCVCRGGAPMLLYWVFG